MVGCIGHEGPRKGKDETPIECRCTGCNARLGGRRPTYVIAGIIGRFCMACFNRICEPKK